MSESTKKALSSVIGLHAAGLFLVGSYSLLGLPSVLLQVSLVIGAPVVWFLFFFNLKKVGWATDLEIAEMEWMELFAFSISFSVLVFLQLQDFMLERKMILFLVFSSGFVFSLCFLRMALENRNDALPTKSRKSDVFQLIFLSGIGVFFAIYSYSLVLDARKVLGLLVFIVSLFISFEGVRFYRKRVMS